MLVVVAVAASALVVIAASCCCRLLFLLSLPLLLLCLLFLLLLLLLLLFLLLLLLLSLLLFLAARASAAAWGGAISWLACAETRVLALWPLDKKFGFLFSHRYLRYFLQKKARIWHTALSNNMLASSFRIVFFGVFCVCRISIVFCSVWAISRLSAHAGFDLQFSFFSVRGDFSESSCAVWWCGAVVGGVGGVFSFCFLHLLVLFGGVVRCGRGGGGWGGVGGGG